MCVSLLENSALREYSVYLYFFKVLEILRLYEEQPIFTSMERPLSASTDILN